MLFAGGTASEGPSFDIEIYDPATGVVGARGRHDAGPRRPCRCNPQDGRVLIVGGFGGQSSLNLAETFDPRPVRAPVSRSCRPPSVKATATTLLDGHVLVAGGNDGTQDLASAEIFDAASGAFFATGAMRTARSGHVAVLLPNNNQVLIAGVWRGARRLRQPNLRRLERRFFEHAEPDEARRAPAASRAAFSRMISPSSPAATPAVSSTEYATVKTDRRTIGRENP